MDNFLLNELPYDLMLDSVPNALLMVNNNGEIVYFNQYAITLFQYTSEELTGQKIENLVANQYADFHPKLREGFFNNPSTRAMGSGRDLFAKKKDGTEFPVQIGLKPLNTPQGVLVIASIIDLTERKEIEQQLQQVVESSPNALLLINKEGIINMANKQALITFGYTENELTGAHIDILIPTEIRSMHKGYRGKYHVNPVPRSMGSGRDLYAVKKNGTKFPVEIGLNPLHFKDELKILASVIDITERKKAENKIREHATALELKNKEIENLAYIVSHDLKEPARSLEGIARLLEMELGENSNERLNEYINHIKNSTSRMQEMISSLMEYSKIGSEKSQEVVDCNELIKSVLFDLSSLIDKNSAEIHLGTLPLVKAYPTELRLLFQNLINNAIKFRKPDTVPQIHVKHIKNSDFHLFEVEDNGIGISDEHREKIFEIFSRLHNRDEYEGTGIGLAHCKKIVELHNGWINVEGKDSGGSIFKFAISKNSHDL